MGILAKITSVFKRTVSQCRTAQAAIPKAAFPLHNKMEGISNVVIADFERDLARLTRMMDANIQIFEILDKCLTLIDEYIALTGRQCIEEERRIRGVLLMYKKPSVGGGNNVWRCNKTGGQNEIL